jgi:hypothetical protein
LPVKSKSSFIAPNEAISSIFAAQKTYPWLYKQAS